MHPKEVKTIPKCMAARLSLWNLMKFGVSLLFCKHFSQILTKMLRINSWWYLKTYQTVLIFIMKYFPQLPIVPFKKSLKFLTDVNSQKFCPSFDIFEHVFVSQKIVCFYIKNIPCTTCYLCTNEKFYSPGFIVYYLPAQ